MALVTILRLYARVIIGWKTTRMNADLLTAFMVAVEWTGATVLPVDPTVTKPRQNGWSNV